MPVGNGAVTDTDYLQECADIPRELAEIVVVEANKYGFTLKQLRGPSRERHRYWVRRNIARIARLRDDPFSYPQIGRALNRDHSSIVSMIRGRRGE